MFVVNEVGHTYSYEQFSNSYTNFCWYLWCSKKMKGFLEIVDIHQVCVSMVIESFLTGGVKISRFYLMFCMDKV